MSSPIGNDKKTLDGILRKVGQSIAVKAGVDIWDVEAEEWTTPEEDWSVVLDKVYSADELEVGRSGWNDDVLFYEFTRDMWKQLRKRFGVKVTLADLWKYMRDDGTHVFVILSEPEVEFVGPDGRTYWVELPDLLELP